MKRIRLSLFLMILTILLVALGQTYWLFKLYNHEFDNLKKGMDAQFRNSFYTLQRIRFLKDSSLFSQVLDTVFIEPEKKIMVAQKKPKKNILVNVDGVYFTDSMAKKKLDSIKPENIRSISIVKAKNQPLPPEFFESIILKAGDTSETDPIHKLKKKPVQGIYITLAKDTTPVKSSDQMGVPIQEKRPPEHPNKITYKESKNKALNSSKNPMIQVIYNNKTLNDSIPISVVKLYFQKSLSPNQQILPYQVIRESWKRNEIPQFELAKDTLKGFISSPQLSGIQKTFSYQILFPDVQYFIFKQMGGQIIGSFLMILILITAFVFIYHTMRRQKRLSDIKNEFISNITHELKTPIATVHVALEALQNFKAIDVTQKTKEYLDISMSELNRLELLVDNVLKRSLFEKDSIKLEYSSIDLDKIIQHVLQTLKIQFDKTKAEVNVHKEGCEFSITGDQLHISNVIYNLLDNALKYRDGKPYININLFKEKNKLVLSIEDKGIGIPDEYKGKIFQPFFRVPNMDRHNVKGHGLGLSYVAQIIKLHNGTISISNGKSNGCIFTIKLPLA